MLTCLEKERTRRYKDAGELGKDLVRYLKHEPIAARRPSLLYRVSKLVRRHGTSVVSGLIVLLVVCAQVRCCSCDPVDLMPMMLLRCRIPHERTVAPTRPKRSDQAKAATARISVHRLPTYRGTLMRRSPTWRCPMRCSIAATTAESVTAWSLPDGRRTPAADTADLKPQFIEMSRWGASCSSPGKREVSYVELEMVAATGGICHAVVPPALSHDGGLIAMGFEDLSLNLFTPDGRQLDRVTSSSGAFSRLVFRPRRSPGGRHRGSCTHQPQSGRIAEIGRLNHGSSPPFRPIWSSRTRVDCCCRFRTSVVSVYNIDASEEASMNRAVGMGELVSCSFDPDGTAVLAIEETTFYVIDLETYELLTPSMPLPESDVPYVLGPRAPFIAHGSVDGGITVIPLAPPAP